MTEKLGWDNAFMISHIGWKATVAVVINTLIIGFIFGRQLRDLGERTHDGARIAVCVQVPERQWCGRGVDETDEGHRMPPGSIAAVPAVSS